MSSNVDESFFKENLKKYCLYDALIVCGKASTYIARNTEDGFMYIDPNSKIGTTQTSLAYIANMLLLSSSNDHRTIMLGHNIANPRNKDYILFEKLNLYFTEKIPEPYKAISESTSLIDQLYYLTLSFHLQQFNLQYNLKNLLTRNWIIFSECLDSKYKIQFENQTGITVEDYLRIVMAIGTVAKDTGHIKLPFNIDPGLENSKFGDFITEPKLLKCLEIISIGYQAFRDIDKLRNEDLDPNLTKLRFNPLRRYPLIKSNIKFKRQNLYIIPNFPIYYKTVLNLYWWFEAENGMIFRDNFGTIFENYIGKLLSEIYGDKVEKGPKYNKRNKEFSDWVVNSDEVIYLIEVKTYQYDLKSSQLDVNRIEEIHKRVAKGFGQLYCIKQDIDTFEELKQYRGKKIIPLLVAMDLPWLDIRAGKGESLLQRSIDSLEQEDQKYKGISNFESYIIDVDRIERLLDTLK